MRGSLIILAAHTHGLVLPPSFSRTCAPTMSIANTIDDEHAKRQWLSRLDVPSWGQGVIVPSGSAIANEIREEEAKRAWLARIDTPAWGKAASAVAEIAKEALTIDMSEDSTKEVSEEEAKKAWLARLDTPSWGAVAEAMTASSTEVIKQTRVATNTEEEAKKEWLARLDAPSWGQAAKVMTNLVQEASAIQEMTTACDRGDRDACDALSREEEAKKAWLARLDVPLWGAAAAAVSAVSTRVGA